MNQPEKQAEEIPQWFPLKTGFLALFMPKTAGSHSFGVSMRKAYLVHLLGGLLIWYLVACCFCFINGSNHTAFSLAEPFSYGLHQIAVFWFRIVQFPFLALLQLLGTFVATELLALVTAMVLSPWGAIATEETRNSIRNSIQRTWLFTPACIYILLVYIFGRILLSNLLYPQFMLGFESPPVTDRIVIDEFTWFAIEFSYCYLLSLLALISLLRLIGAPRPIPESTIPLMCESCGYDLTGNLIEHKDDQDALLASRCPECGIPLEESIGPGTRPGTHWNQSSGFGRIKAWFIIQWMAIFCGKQLGASMQLRDRMKTHTFCWFLYWCVTTCVGAFALLFVFRNEKLDVFPVAFAAIFSFLIPAGIAVSLNCVLGFFHSWRTGRNLLCAMNQAGACLTGYFLFLTGLFWFQIFLMYETNGFNSFSRTFLDQYGIDQDIMIGILFFLGPVVIGLIVYLFLPGRILTTARYANR